MQCPKFIASILSRLREPINQLRQKVKFSRQCENAQNKPTPLKSTKPEFREEQHGRYVYRLLDAIYDQDCKNVALTGSYGCGKSSILERFILKAEQKGHKVARISFATFHQECPIITHAPDDEKSSSSTRNASANVANNLEREILGQLLYQGKPSKATRSSFNQVHRTSAVKYILETLVLAALFLLAIVMMLFSMDGRRDKLPLWIDSFSGAISGRYALNPIAILSIFFFSFVIALGLRSLFSGFNLKAFSMPSLNLSLDKKEGTETYFNKYRDELIYLFEENKFDTVIFEDIDRFDNLLIFEELRNLNGTLNLAPGIVGTRGKSTVHFVYAIKDGIFAPLEDTCTESKDVLGATRVKFFDMIISVVPFISEFNAKEMISKVFNNELENSFKTEDGRRFNSLLKLSSPYIADMRLLINIRNDYLIMRDEMGNPSFDKPTNLGLTCSGLLGMSIYKNLLPSDFEKLRVGKGKLNELYSIFQEGVNSSLNKFVAAKKLCVKEEDSGDCSDDIGHKLGKALLSALDDRIPAIDSITIGDTAYSVRKNADNNIFQADFWSSYFQLESYDHIYIGDGPYQNNTLIKLTKYEFVNLFCPNLPDRGIASVLEYGDEHFGVGNLETEIEKLRSADFYMFPELKCPTVNTDGFSQFDSFSNIVKSIYGEGLAAEMVLQGFIQKDFDLYVSKYPQKAKPGAVNFISHCYRRGLLNPDLKLTHDECDEILSIIPVSNLSRTCCINHHLLSYVLEQGRDSATASSLVEGLINDYDGAGRATILWIVGKYGINDRRVVTLIDLMMSLTDHAIDYLSETSFKIAEIDARYEFMLHVFERINYRGAYTADIAAVWVAENTETINLSRIDHEGGWANAMATYLDSCNVQIYDLSNIGPYLRSAILKRGNFIINRHNLSLASEADGILDLNSLMEDHIDVYKKILSSFDGLESYLYALQNGEVSVKQLTPALFEAICQATENSSSGEIEPLANMLIANAGRMFVPVDLDALLSGQPLDTLNAMGLTLIQDLVKTNHVERTPKNAFILLQIDKLHYIDRSLSMFSNYVDHKWFENEILISDEIDEIEAKQSVKGLLYESTLGGASLINALNTVKSCYESLFPISVDPEALVNLGRNAETTVALYEFGLICPGEIIYRYLGDQDWTYRKRVLTIWLIEHPVADFTNLPELFAFDLAPIALAESDWGSWLAADIKQDLDFYIEHFCDDSNRDTVRAEFDKINHESESAGN